MMQQEARRLELEADGKYEINTIDLDSGAVPKEISEVVDLININSAMDPSFMQEGLLKHERIDDRVQGMLRLIEMWLPNMDAQTLLALSRNAEQREAAYVRAVER